MLFNGEAIFGVVNPSGQEHLARCKAEQISQRASYLGASVDYEAMGSAVFGRVKRKISCYQHNVQKDRSAIRVAIVGEVLATQGAHGQVVARDHDLDWIAAGYEARGTEFLSQLDGTFALALWEPKDRQLTLMTDPRSDAQLFYRLEADQIVFSSWLSLLVGQKQDVDRNSFHEFLRFLYVAPPKTIYKGICRLEPGHYLEASNGTVTVHALKCGDQDGDDRPWLGSTDEALDRFQELFESAIERRIGSRRAGVFLSSGVDSATLMAGCHRINPGRVEAFTVGFDNAELDETSAAHAYADHFGVPHSVLKFGMKDYRRAFESMSREFDQPFADPAGLPLILASESMKERADVFTGGTGGDDLFGAPVPRHLWFSLTFASKLPNAFRLKVATAIKNASGFSRYSSLFDFDDPEELLITWSGWSKREQEQLFAESVCFAESGFYRIFRAFQDGEVQNLYDALGVFPPDDCRFEAAAPVNIPIELPYHDVDLHAYVKGLPSSFRIRDGVSKFLLKQLFGRYFPKDLQLAKKHYFNMPLPSLMAHNNFEIVREYLTRDILVRHNLVDYERAGLWIDRYVAGDESLMFKIWALAVLHAWLESRN